MGHTLAPLTRSLKELSCGLHGNCDVRVQNRHWPEAKCVCKCANQETHQWRKDYKYLPCVPDVDGKKPSQRP